MEVHSRYFNDKIQIAVPLKHKDFIKEISNSLSVYRPNYKHEKGYKLGRTDGKERFYKLQLIKQQIAVFDIELGFYDTVKKIFDKHHLPFLEKQVTPFSKESITEFMKKTLGTLPFKPRKYQVQITYNFLLNKRHFARASTGAGKSLVAYLTMLYLFQNNKKCILVVPTIDLVSQMYSDFEEFNAPQDFLNNIQKIGGDFKGKELSKPVVISTWQSLKNIKSEIQKYDTLFVDELHKAKAEVLSDISKTKIPHKIGMTGSVPGVDIDRMKIIENFGEPVTYVTAKDLIDLGILSKTKIVVVYLNYPRKETKSGLKYQQEMKLIKENEKRKKFLYSFINKIKKKGISVCTFNTTKYGEEIYYRLANQKINRIRNDFEKQKEHKVFFIDGKTKAQTRKQIREYLNSDQSSNEVLIAQTTVIDTGTNIPKMKNLVFLEPPGKSFTKIIQSIGRVMRKHQDKGDCVYVFDIVDVFDYKTENYCFRHFWERLNYYESEQHEIIESEKSL